MKLPRFFATTLVLGTIFSQPASAQWIPTNAGNGADVEVRESNPTQNRGDSTEIATRVRNDFIAGDGNDGGDRNSAIYTRFDLSGASNPADIETAFTLTYRNNNLTESRIQDSVTPNPAIRTGLAVYGLNNDALSNWVESTINYLTAPGLTADGDVGTVDVNSDLTFLGTVEFPDIGTQNHLPVGGELRFCSDNLDGFVKNALDNAYTSVTLVSMRIHGGDVPLANWLNFNYLFNPKEQTILNDDSNYDPDGQGPVGSPWSGADNSTGAFSPALGIVDGTTLKGDDLCAPPNQPVDCSAAYPSRTTLWPANGELRAVKILGITDGDNDPLTLTIDTIFQDEPTSEGSGSLTPDGSGIGTDTAYLRAERLAGGNGRVYTVSFTADDGFGGACSGEVKVAVPSTMGPNGTAVDDGPVYDSTLP